MQMVSNTEKHRKMQIFSVSHYSTPVTKNKRGHYAIKKKINSDLNTVA